MHSFSSIIAGANVRWHDLPGHGLPVVFIHGLGCASSYEYTRIVTDSAFSQRRAILVDLPGFGFSDKPEHFGYTTTEQAAVVVELLDTLALDKFDLYGHSMGGSIAIQVAEALGHRVHTLAVSEPNFHSGGGMYSQQVVSVTETHFIDSMFYELIAAESSPWKGCLQNSSPQAIWRAAKSLIDGVTPSWEDRFLNLSCRKALIFGEYSLPDDDADVLSRNGIPLHIIPKAGHSMSWENPSALAETLGEIFTPPTD